MSNEEIQKDAIGEHEGFMNNPLLAFFVALLLIAAFTILGQYFHVTKRQQSPDVIDRLARFEKVKDWRSTNEVNLERYASGQINAQGATTYYQIPLSEAKALLVEENAPRAQ